MVHAIGLPRNTAGQVVRPRRPADRGRHAVGRAKPARRALSAPSSQRNDWRRAWAEPVKAHKVSVMSAVGIASR
ncbi:MAG: hypothetical protein RLY71_3488 [Pseudomonadota bacterium]